MKIKTNSHNNNSKNQNQANTLFTKSVFFHHFCSSYISKAKWQTKQAYFQSELCILLRVVAVKIWFCLQEKVSINVFFYLLDSVHGPRRRGEAFLGCSAVPAVKLLCFMQSGCFYVNEKMHIKSFFFLKCFDNEWLPYYYYILRPPNNLITRLTWRRYLRDFPMPTTNV